MGVLAKTKETRRFLTRYWESNDYVIVLVCKGFRLLPTKKALIQMSMFEVLYYIGKNGLLVDVVVSDSDLQVGYMLL